MENKLICLELVFIPEKNKARITGKDIVLHFGCSKEKRKLKVAKPIREIDLPKAEEQVDKVEANVEVFGWARARDESCHALECDPFQVQVSKGQLLVQRPPKGVPVNA